MSASSIGYASLSKDLKLPIIPITAPMIIMTVVKMITTGCRVRGIISVKAMMAKNKKPARKIHLPHERAG